MKRLTGAFVAIVLLFGVVLLTITPASAAELSAASFTQEEHEDPTIWYDEPDRTVTLSATPANTVYTRLIAEIQAAPAHSITHIIIPFHINVGNIGTGTATVVGIRDGATVVLIGDHPTAANGQAIISDTHGGGGLSRTFRLRGDGSEQSGLVLRNIILQTAPQAAQGIPATAPNPLTPAQQVNNTRGGGVAIEPGSVTGITGAGGGGHLILCRGGVIRNSSTDNNGPVDIQTDGRFTMMPGSEMHTNVAGNSGGAVHVNTRGTFTMYGGIIRDNLARGERVDANQTMQRAVGGAVFIQNAGTFNMYGGEIYENRARLGEIAAAPNATNAIVTSSGGGVFATGAGSTVNLYGGTIRNNYAIRTRTSAIATTTAAASVRANYRAGNGGGVYLTNGAVFHMYGGHIQNNIATNEGTVTNTGSNVNGLNLSNGGGVYLTGATTRFELHGGEIHDNEAVRTNNAVPTAAAAQGAIWAGNGGGVHVFGGSFVMLGGEIYANTATATGGAPANHAVSIVRLSNGGGVFLANAGSLTSDGGTIHDNRATGTVTAATSISGNGGGVYTEGTSTVDMPGGEIEANTATNDGGGLYVQPGTLGNVTIAPGAVFQGNVAQNGIRIDNALATEYRGQINPGTVSVTWHMADEYPVGSGSFVDVPPHALTNYDINATGPNTFWRVTYGVEGGGAVTAQMGSNNFPLASGVFVPDGATVAFQADPIDRIDWWDIGTRTQDGTVEEFPFAFQNGGAETPLSVHITAHTHVIGNLKAVVLHTTLTVSKTVSGAFGNQDMAFPFAIHFADATGVALPAGTQFPYTGNGVEDGLLTLDEHGTATFALAHGQAIRVEEIPQGTQVQVAETQDANYATSYTVQTAADDIIHASEVTVQLTEVCEISFTNERIVPPPTGVDLGNIGAMLVLPLVVLTLAIAAAVVIKKVR